MNNFHIKTSRLKFCACLQTLFMSQVDLDDQQVELRTAEDAVKRAHTETSKMADDLRMEKEHAQQVDKTRRTLEMQVKELQVLSPHHHVTTKMLESM